MNSTVSFKWNSNVKILEAIWGIRKGGSANPQYISVDDTEVSVINPSLDPDLKRRLHYNGSLAAGQAWFSISNVNLNDSHTYIALIREENSTQVAYTLEVIVSLTGHGK